MARKRHTLFHRMDALLKHLISGWHLVNVQKYQRWCILLFLSLFLSIMVIPLLSRPSQANPGAPHEVDAPTLVTEGQRLYQAGKPSEAIAALTQAIKLFQANADEDNETITVTNLSRIYQEVGLYSRACRAMTAVIAADDDLCVDQTLSEDILERQTSKFYGLSAAIKVPYLRSLGDIFRVMGRLDNAKIVLEKSLTLADDPYQQAATHLSLGNTLRAKGDLERDRRAPPRYEAMAWRCEETIVPPVQAIKHYNEADKYYGKAIDIADVSNHPRWSRLSAKAKLNRLNLLIDTNGKVKHQWTEENERWSETKVLLRNIDLTPLSNPQERAYGHIQLAKNHVCFHDKTNTRPEWDNIERQLQAVNVIAESSGEPRLKSYALGNRGGLYEYRAWWLEQLTPNQVKHQNQSSEEKEALKNCNTARQCRKEAKRWTEKALVLAQPNATPDIAYQWQWQLGRLAEADGNREEAIAYYQIAVTTLESVRNDLLTINSDVQFSFRDNIEPIYRKLIDLQLIAEKKAQKNNQQSLEVVLQAIDLLRLAELENFLGCDLSQSVQLEPTTAREIDPTAAFIYPIILADRIEVIYQLPQQELTHHSIGVDHKEVENEVQELGANLAFFGRESALKQGSQKLYNWLIEPGSKFEIDLEALRKKGKVKTLVFSLDDTLRNIPMAMLYNGEEYLIQKYAVAVIPTRQLLDSRPRQKSLNVLTVGVSEQRVIDNKTFNAIPSVANELFGIKKISQLNSELLLNQQFTGIELEKQVDSALFPVVHIATHGVFSSDPNETFILTWDKRVKVADFDRILQISGENRPKSLELLVLSACQTAKGNRRASLGLAGIAAQARVRTTIATLWEVNDKSTAKFMIKFYDELAQGSTIAEALRKTQLLFLDNSDELNELGDFDQEEENLEYRHPFFWAPFIMVGNWT